MTGEPQLVFARRINTVAMTDRVVRRIALAVVLLCVIGVSAVDYAATADERSVYPTAAELADAYDEYHGERIVVWVRVASVSDGQFAGGEWTVRAESVPSAVDVGDSVEVAGVARPGRVVVAERIVVTDARNRGYMFAVSALALVGTTLFLFSRWRISREQWALVPRDGDDGTSGGRSP